MKTLDLFEQNNFPELIEVTEESILVLLSRLGVSSSSIYLERESRFNWCFHLCFLSNLDRAEAWSRLRKILRLERLDETNMFCPAESSPLIFVEKIYTSSIFNKFETLLEVTK